MTPENDWLVWAVIVAGGVLTFGLRASFIFLLDRIGDVPPRLERTLRYVPAAVLAALVAPALLLVDGRPVLDPWNEQILAALAAIVVAWVTENIFATIGVGMAVFWAVRFLA